MKKIALTSLLAVFAVSGAHAANVIDGNPLYRPDAGRFYSVTTLGSHSEANENWTLAEEFGYGITDKLAVIAGTSFAEEDSFDAYGWNDLSIGLNYRVVDMNGWKADVIGTYAVDGVYPYHAPFLEEDLTEYTWTAGIRAGYVGESFTIAGHIAYDYSNSESFNWDEDGLKEIRAGLDAQYLINADWNLVLGAEYKGILNDEAENAGEWTGAFGVNYNIDETKFIGAFISTVAEHSTGDWEIADGFGFGVKFGIDF